MKTAPAMKTTHTDDGIRLDLTLHNGKSLVVSRRWGRLLWVTRLKGRTMYSTSLKSLIGRIVDATA